MADPIIAVPAHPGQPYDASATDTIAGWEKPSGDDFPDGPGPWQQV